MNRRTLALLILAATGTSAVAQTLIVHDPLLQSSMEASIANAASAQIQATVDLRNLTELNHAELRDLIAQQIALAEASLLQIEEGLRRTGDPGLLIAPVGAAEASVSIELGKDLLPTNAELESLTGQADGSAVFDSDVDGLMREIGSTYKDRDGNTQPRDPDYYRSEAAMQNRIDEYKRVRGIATERRRVLQDALVDALRVVAESEDFAVLEKQKAVIDIIQAEIAASDRAIEIAAQDVEMLEREINNQRVISSKASNEAIRRQPATEGGDPGDSEEGLSILQLPRLSLEDIGIDRRLRWGP